MSRRRAVGAAAPELGVALVVGLLSAAFSWLRLDATTRRTVWAEDGVVFLRQRLDDGLLDTLLLPYAGYQHLVPRLVSDLAGLMSVDRYAVATTSLCCAVVGAVAAATYLSSAGVLERRWVRVLLGLWPALVPLAPVEVLGNATNVHTYLLWLTPWLLLHRPRTRLASVAVAVVVLVCLLTEVQALVFMPLLLLGVRERLRWPVVGAACAAAAAQIVTAVVSPRPAAPSTGVPGALDVAKAYLMSTILPFWHPSADGAGRFAQQGWWVAAATALPVLIVVVACLVVAARRSRPDLWLALTLLVGATVPFVAAVLLNPLQGSRFAGLDASEAGALLPLRYGVAAQLFLGGLAIVLVDLLRRRAADRTRSPHPRRIALAAVVALVAAVVASGLIHVRPPETRRSDGPEWAPSVAEARLSCRREGVPQPVRAAPKRTWAVTLTCAELGVTTDEASPRLAAREAGETRPVLVAGAGFEPAKEYSDGFTVRSHWPLGQPAGCRRACVWRVDNEAKQ